MAAVPPVQIPCPARRRAAALMAAVPVLLLAAAGCRPRPAPPAAAPGDGIRLASLAPSLTEIICTLGAADCLVGRTSVCNYPPGDVAGVAVVGDFGVPSLEMLASVRPTLVLEVDLADPTLAARIEDLGLARRRIPCRTLDDIPSAIRDVGRLTGRDARAADLAAGIENGIAALRRSAAPASADAPTVFVEIWADPLTTVGRTSFVSELVTLAGGRNIAADVERDYFQVSPEWVIARDPDVILCLYMSEDARPRARVLARAGWETVAAVRHGRIHDRFDVDILLRPGPRVLDGIAQLRARLSAEQHDDRP
jgi:iron complex transport system substrate-binding protein